MRKRLIIDTAFSAVKLGVLDFGLCVFAVILVSCSPLIISLLHFFVAVCIMDDLWIINCLFIILIFFGYDFASKR